MEVEANLNVTGGIFGGALFKDYPLVENLFGVQRVKALKRELEMDV